MKRTTYLALTIILAVLAVTSASAVVSKELNFPIYDFKESGSRFTGAKTVDYNFYYSSAGGSSALTETHNEVFIDGVAHVTIADAGQVDWSKNVWLELTVSGTILSPRIKLASAPDSLNNPFQTDGTAFWLKNLLSYMNSTLNVTGSIYAGNSPVCTPGNALCAGSVGNESDPTWAANYSLYTPTSGLVSALGNWSADLLSYALIISLDSVNSTAVNKASPGNCPDGQVVMNTTTTGVQCVAMSTSNNTSTVNNYSMSISVQSIDNYIVVANGTVSNFSANLTAFDARYYLSSNPSNYISSYSETDPTWAANYSLYTPSASLVTALGNWSKDKLNNNYVTATGCDIGMALQTLEGNGTSTCVSLGSITYQNSAAGWTNTTTTTSTSLNVTIGPSGEDEALGLYKTGGVVYVDTFGSNLSVNASNMTIGVGVVCTSTNGICSTSSPSSGGGWVNDTASTNTSLNVRVAGNIGVGAAGANAVFSLSNSSTGVLFDLYGRNASFNASNITIGSSVVCTNTNGLCGSSGTVSANNAAGWTNDTANTNTSLNVLVKSGNLSVGQGTMFFKFYNLSGQATIDTQGYNLSIANSTNIKLNGNLSVGSGPLFLRIYNSSTGVIFDPSLRNISFLTSNVIVDGSPVCTPGNALCAGSVVESDPTWSGNYTFVTNSLAILNSSKLNLANITTCSGAQVSAFNGTGFNCTTVTATVTGGYINNNVTSVTVDGTTTKTVQLNQTGGVMTSINASFTDIDTDTWNTTQQMRAAVNGSAINITGVAAMSVIASSATTASSVTNGIYTTTVVGAVGNWSADKGAYVGSLSFNQTALYLNTTKLALANITTCANGLYSVYNGTGFNCTAAATSGGSYANSAAGWVNDTTSTNTTLNARVQGNLSVGSNSASAFLRIYNTSLGVVFDSALNNVTFPFPNVTVNGSAVCTVANGLCAGSVVEADPKWVGNYSFVINSLSWLNSSKLNLANITTCSNGLYSVYNGTGFNCTAAATTGGSYANSAAGWVNDTTSTNTSLNIRVAGNISLGATGTNAVFTINNGTTGVFFDLYGRNASFNATNITINGAAVCTATNGVCSAAVVPYQQNASGWSNETGQIKTDKIVNITGALCLGAENGVMPCRNFFGDEESARRYMSVQMDPFIGGGAETGEYGSWGWTTAAVGTGTDVTAGAAPDVTALGAISIGSGTVAAGNASLLTSPGTIHLNGSSGLTGWFGRVRSNAISDGTENITIIVGFSDTSNSVVGVDAIAAVYNSTTNLGHYWSFRSCANSACTNNVTTQAVAANTWYDLECQIYNATMADCYVNGVYAATLWTNIPSGSTRDFYPGRLAINKNLGTTERRLYIDYYGIYRVFDDPKW